MRFVPVKTAQQQGLLAVHRMREGFKEELTALINRIRGILAEFGLVYPKSTEALREVLATILEDASNELPDIARLVVQSAHKHWGDLDEQIAWCDERIVGHARSDERAKKVATLMGIGPVTASAVMTAAKRDDRISRWLLQLKERVSEDAHTGQTGDR
jgi:transposase